MADPFTVSTEKLAEFQKELATLINRYSIENLLNTPDFIIAENMVNHLIATANIVSRRDKWYSFDPWGDLK